MKKIFLSIIASLSILSACGEQTEDTQADVLSASYNTTTVQAEGSVLELTAASSDEVDVAALTERLQEDEFEGISGALMTGGSEFEGNIFNDKTLIPGCVANLDSDNAMYPRKYVVNIPETAELGNITVNDVDIDISDITLDDFLSASHLERCSFAETDLQYADYEFISGMYGIVSCRKTPTGFTPYSFDSLMSIEIVNSDGELVHNEDDITDYDRSCAVKGVCTSDFFMTGDFDVIYYGGIKCGMALDDIYASLGGEGFVYGDNGGNEFHYFCNGRQVLIIMPKDGVAEKIMLLNI